MEFSVLAGPTCREAPTKLGIPEGTSKSPKQEKAEENAVDDP